MYMDNNHHNMYDTDELNERVLKLTDNFINVTAELTLMQARVANLRENFNDLKQTAGEEITRLRAEVARLRLTGHEPAALAIAEMLLQNDGFTEAADDIAAIAKRLGGGE